MLELTYSTKKLWVTLKLFNKSNLFKSSELLDGGNHRNFHLAWIPDDCSITARILDRTTTPTTGSIWSRFRTWGTLALWFGNCLPTRTYFRQNSPLVLNPLETYTKFSTTLCQSGLQNILNFSSSKKRWTCTWITRDGGIRQRWLPKASSKHIRINVFWRAEGGGEHCEIVLISLSPLLKIQ